MAATIQTPTQQQPPSMNNKSVANPQLKRIVYSKYRELLGSYNDKANAIIDSLPAYMVKEDRGFHFDPKIIEEVDNVVYGTPPAPPPLSAGSIPSQRLSTQIPQYNVVEAPACVQNAMMTKDKKPFTYTPGGIDLSQIKSQRMAKRLARNAQSEGTTGHQQMHRPTQQNINGGTAPGAASQLGATAMGMPFQVLPTGPPPPPQPARTGAPPPPPPPSAPQNNTLAPQSNGNAARRSPTPQNFEPPPMGFRPEIKIPPNPMAILKKVPPPQEKNNFWMEEYRKERSKSPMVGNDENDSNRSSPNNPQPETNQNSYNSNNNNSQENDYQPQQIRAPQSPQPIRQENNTQRQPSPPKTPVQQLEQPRRVESPYQTQYSQQQQSPPIQRQTSSPQQQQQSPTMQRQPSQQYQNSPQNSPQIQQQHQQQQSPTMQRQQLQQHQSSPQHSPQIQQQQSPTMQRQPSQQYQSSPQHSPQIQRQQSIPTPQYQSSPQQSPPIQRQQTAPQQQYQSPTPPQYQQQPQQQQTSPTQQQSVPWRQQKQIPSGIQNNVSRPRDVLSPAPAESPKPQPQNQQQQQQQQQYPAYLRSREVLSPAPELQPAHVSHPYQQKNAQVGSIYIPPVAVQQQHQQSSSYQDTQGFRQQQAPRQAPTNRWMNAQGQTVETPTLNRIKSPPPPSASSNGFGSLNNAGLRLQINNNTSNSNGKERIIPIQLEQTPTPTRTPAAPGFGPQPFYNAQQQQYSSVPSPPLAQGTPSNGQNSPNYIIRSPNQFVDQGYNQYPGAQDHPNRVTSPPMQQSPRVIQQTNTAGVVKTRIIPISVESQPDGPLNPNNARGPISQQPIVIQNDPRNQNAWGSGSATPTQSKSFRILQKITDTSDDNALENKAIESDGGDQEPQLQRPSYARQMTSTGQINSPTIEQMKRMQLNNEQAFANRARNQDEDEKSASEDPRYRGPSNPSKTFKKLQGAIERCSPSRTDQNGTPPVMKQPQPNRYVNQRPVYSPEEHSQQYVHPSQQHVPEPKIYTGSAIPSRSFKILQAMTTPENAAESDGSDVVETDTSINECPYQQQPPPSYPYPYPYLPSCCAHPPPPPPSTSSSGGDVNNWQYPPPYHPHPHPHHPYPQHHPHQHYPHHQHQHQHPHPAYPYPPPCPCYYYNCRPNDYDSQNCSSRSSLSSRGSFSRGRSHSQDLPNIIITPSTDDVPQELNAERLARNQREKSVIETLSERLSELSKSENNELNVKEENNKKHVEDNDQEFESSSSSTRSVSEKKNSKISSEDSSDDLLSSSSDPTSTSRSEECAELIPSDGLQAIKSVTNIQFYNKKMMAKETEDDDRTIADDESMIFDEAEEEDIIGEEFEYDEEEGIVEEINSEEEELEEEEEIEVFEEDDVIIMDDLSVIYEENEADLISPRPASRISSSVSETSTLANEECEEEEEEVVKKEDDEEDNSNSVTVRLPLKFSFSRSSNDENVATIEVGDSQIDDRGRSFSIASIEAGPDDYETDSQDCDVSVTISLSRSSESVDQKVMSDASPVSPHLAPEIITEENSLDSDEEEDVSVSFSLPMRNKFMNQTWNGDLTNNICMVEDEEAAVETWRKNNRFFEESDEKLNTTEGAEHRNEADEKTDSVEQAMEEKDDQKQTDKNQIIEGSSVETQEETDDEEEDKETEPETPTDEVVNEELDFWATLQATRKEAKLFLEKTAGYWGKSVDGKEKPEPIPSKTPVPKEEEKDEDFWSNIRVKNPKDTEEKKEPKPKSTKLKKKKKVVKVPVKEPIPEPQPEQVLTIIKLPNANNKSKVVESAIQMIQEKTKKPKKLVKQVSKEEVKFVKEALENEIVQISKEVEEEKKLIEEAKTRRASLCKAKSIDKPKIEEVIVEKEEEDIKNKLVREKAELKTQIINQKFAKAFVIPNKPLLMKGILSGTECEASISNFLRKSVPINVIEEKNSISNLVEKPAASNATVIKIESEVSVSKCDTKVKERKDSIPQVLVSHEMESLATASSEIVKEEPKKVVKKKISKTKSVEKESDGNTLKLPKAKSVKKSSKEPKKTKTKKEGEVDCTIKIEEVKEVEEQKVSEGIFEDKSKIIIKDANVVAEKSDNESPSVVVKQESQEIEEPDFWAEIEASKSSENLSKEKEKLSIDKAIATDPWANIETKKETEETNIWPSSEKNEVSSKTITQEIDFWADIESVIVKNITKPQEPDIWAEIEQQTKPQILVESSKLKTQCKVLAEQIQALEWSKTELSKAQHLKKSEVHTPIVLNGCIDYWVEKTSEIYEKPLQKNEESQESITVKKQEGKDLQTSSTSSDLQPTESKPKKKLKKSVGAIDIETDSEATKPKSKKKSSVINKEQNDVSTKNSKKILCESDLQSETLAMKLSSKRKTSVSKDEPIECAIKPELLKSKKNISTPDEDSTKLETALKVKTKKKDVEKRLSVKSKSKNTPSLAEEEEKASPAPSKKTLKSCSLQVYSDYDIELIHQDPEAIFYTTYSELEPEISFWATVSYAEEEAKVVGEQEIDFWASNSSSNQIEMNAEIDTDKIDFWVTQRKFEANSGLVEEKSIPSKEEPTEEVDFWAEIKGPNEDVCEKHIPNNDTEVCQNNYKKAMAFFTNTVTVNKKEEPKKIMSVLDEAPSWPWMASAEPEWEVHEQRESTDVFLTAEDNETTEDEPDTLIENISYEVEESYNHIKEQQQFHEDEESQSSESISDSTPNHFQIEHLYPKPEPEPIRPKELTVESIPNQTSEESNKISVKDRIFAFETGTVEPPATKAKTSLIVDSTSPKGNLSRNSSQRSESEIEEDDSGVTDMNKPLSETDTESESFPELRKMSRYQRASTHSRLFKLLQDEGDVIEEEQPGDEEALEAEFNFKPRKKIVHNVSITRKQNPKALQEAETVTQRRQRLSLPLRKNQSIDADNPSSPNSPASPIQGQQSQPISDKLVNELIQSLLLKKSSASLKNLPMEKLQAAAKRVLEEELDSLENNSLDSTPALTPQEFKNESYADYYDTWSSKMDADNLTNGSFEILPSKAFKVLQETAGSAKRKPWAVRCPRVLSSKTVNRDLARVTESPEIVSRSSRSPEMFSSDRASSVGRWKKV